MIETFGSYQVLFLLIVMALTATVAGFFAGFFGIGGGIITVPCLFYIFNSSLTYSTSFSAISDLVGTLLFSNILFSISAKK